MRRENRRRNVQNKTLTDKIILYSLIGVAILAVIVFAMFLYSKSLSDDMKNGTMNLEEIANRTNNNSESNETNEVAQNTQSASTEIGKTVEQSQNELNSNNTSSSNTVNMTKTTSNSSNVSNTKNMSNTNSNTNSSNVNNSKVNQTTASEPKKELSFSKPVDGEVVKEYARDNLIYSDTLQEWTTHMGIDIKADKTTVVNAAEAGTIKSIKNDPRYGLTVVIEHDDTYQTVYSNLLTSEFVVEGEKVEKGQAIGTVGNTAPFEIADEAHLHFEILKDSLQIDPRTFLGI